MDGPECRMGMHVVRENGGPKWTAQSTEGGEEGWEKGGVGFG